MVIPKKSFIKNVAFVFALLFTLLLTACGGGGGGDKSGVTVNEAMVGTWYQNMEDGKSLVTKANGDVDTMILRSDGTCTMKEFDLSNRDHPTYWETDGTVESDNGT